MRYEWSGRKCESLDTNWFFDDYEENETIAKMTDRLCMSCPFQNVCLASGVSNNEWGVWGGVYLEGGKISKQFNKHKDQDAWFNVWMTATTEVI